MTESIREYIERNVVVDANRCWLWQKARDYDGYGQGWIRGTSRKAHRLAYEEWRGEVPAGLQLDHLCRVRHCVNPDHLEPVTNIENIRRGLLGRRWQTDRCIRGHLYIPENTFINTKGSPGCRPCTRQQVRESKARKAARESAAT